MCHDYEELINTRFKAVEIFNDDDIPDNFIISELEDTKYGNFKIRTEKFVPEKKISSYENNENNINDNISANNI